MYRRSCFCWYDTYGHLEGDLVLIKLGELLLKHFEICGRYGGDEFMAVMSDTNIDEAGHVSESLKAEFEKFASKKGYEELSLSIGITSSEHKDIHEMIREADTYMYKMKHDNKIRKI